nr:GNAT family N-acetyltransferase [Actinomyces wuliandei]
MEPVTFTTVRGGEDGPGAEVVRGGVMDVRLEVFVGEQGVPFSMEGDARDDEATTLHVLASGADGVPLGAGRLLLEPGHPGQVHLGRLAVRRVARGTGLGARLVAAVEAAALERAAVPLEGSAATNAGVVPGTPGVRVVLSAQEQAMGFYQRCGYQAVSGRRYLDAGIPHQDMARTVTA